MNHISVLPSLEMAKKKIDRSIAEVLYRYYSLECKLWWSQEFDHRCIILLAMRSMKLGFEWLPCRKSSGFSEISQCPASTSAIWALGKNLLIAGMVASVTYLDLVPRTKRVGPSYWTPSDSLKGKSAMLSRELPITERGTRNFRVLCSSSERTRFVKRNWRIGRDYFEVSRDLEVYISKFHTSS